MAVPGGSCEKAFTEQRCGVTRLSVRCEQGSLRSARSRRVFGLPLHPAESSTLGTCPPSLASVLSIYASSISYLWLKCLLIFIFDKFFFLSSGPLLSKATSRTPLSGPAWHWATCSGLRLTSHALGPDVQPLVLLVVDGPARQDLQVGSLGEGGRGWTPRKGKVGSPGAHCPPRSGKRGTPRGRAEHLDLPVG